MPLKIKGSTDEVRCDLAVKVAEKCFAEAGMNPRECYSEHSNMLEGCVFDADKAGFWQYAECRALEPFVDRTSVYLSWED